jgi:hypothetical protein
VIYRDLDWPHGMICERCERPFRDGDEIACSPLALFANGIPILQPVCGECLGKSDARTGFYRDPLGLGSDEIDRVDAIADVLIPLPGVSDLPLVPGEESPAVFPSWRSDRDRRRTRDDSFGRFEWDVA